MPCARPALAALCLSAAHAFPLSQSWFSSSSDAGNRDPPPQETPSPRIPCHNHRPLPPVDAVEGLRWLDHIVDNATSSPCFKDVNLGWEDIGDADVDKVIRVIEAGVETLSVFQNHLTDESASQIADAIRGSGLRELDLAHNSLGNAGAEDLAAALVDAPRLQMLRLNGNDRIGDRGARAFAAAVQQTGLTLDELWLTSPNIGKAAKEELRLAWLSSGRAEEALHL